MKAAGGTNRAMFHDLFANTASDQEDEDFYKSEEEAEATEIGGSIPGSVPGMPVKTGPKEPESPLNSSMHSRASSRDSNRDFRIKTSTTTRTNSTTGGVNRLQQPKRTTLMGLSKPHQLAS